MLSSVVVRMLLPCRNRTTKCQRERIELTSSYSAAVIYLSAYVDHHELLVCESYFSHTACMRATMVLNDRFGLVDDSSSADQSEIS